ncbi:glycoside hydrolase family 88 protein [Halogeometricum sp. S1BR25-6]|uniref:Glycoside hydrolase family 88 protein n=1 Tax=Halogeometricum salsisoli TaxID=2950536 RepID=A0ABU2GHR1_9EURY|nr:glycoside hydrolase family 88 protein [Halogeometricum sp. S1BR25-6]MDS0300331.1 glycoside hydrolase family 88 protein [Halogeometricum sp. S1BR25-6]
MPRAPSRLAATVTDEGVPERYATPSGVGRYDLQTRLSDAVDRIDDNVAQFYDRFPGPSSEDLVYQPTDNMGGWTTSFWTGQCWLAHEVTGRERFRDAAETQLRTFDRRLAEGDVLTHDLGFLYTLSAVAGYEVTGTERYREMAVTAADHLTDRFWDAPGLLQAWGDPDSPEADEWVHGRMIVDTMMNLPLLFWASEATGEDAYAAIAETHARTNAEHIVRPDGSTFHTFKCDATSGEPLGGETAQGYDDDSCWARGQAWAIYGYALAAEYADEMAYADLAAKLANYYLHRVEPDHVPRWDFDAPADDEVRDTSAAAIAACGLVQLAAVLPVADDRADRYRNAALTTLDSLGEHYASDPERSNGLLTDAAYNRGEGDYDECCLWGDYFYVEGLVRAAEGWRRYW